MLDDAEDIERCIRAYLACALWASTTDDGETAFDDAGYSVDDALPETMARVRAMVARFVTENARDLEALDAEQVGHDLWLTRNGHGAGFWDRDLGEVGDRLTESAHALGEVNVIQLGDAFDIM